MLNSHQDCLRLFQIAIAAREVVVVIFPSGHTTWCPLFSVAASFCGNELSTTKKVKAIECKYSCFHLL